MKERINHLLNKKIKKIYLSDNISLNEKKEQLKIIFQDIDKKINNGYIKFENIYGYGYGKTNRIRDALKDNNNFTDILNEMSEKINNYLIDSLTKDLF